MKKLIILNLLIILSSCSSIRMKYEATIVDDLSHSSIEYYKSYNVGSLNIWCLATGVFLGGACWGYFALPHEEFRKKQRCPSENRRNF